ncbi:MAG: hypothetical protein CEE43_06170 [Promethearchaeota archaeon Loki_b32]|nr:MAG: hypothetical protein CEE43_06170 [Candidatus Lokiarchaeota archaeon Loki_b32]
MPRTGREFSRKFFILILFAGFSLITIAQNFNNNNSTNLVNFDKLRSSPSQGLDHDDHAELHGYADQYVTWSFSTFPSQIINVWALDAFQYSLWIAGQSATGHLLSTDSSDSGTFNVPEGNTWYIVFWNDEVGSQNTLVTYNANFVGDSRPPAINVIAPSSSSSYQTGSSQTIRWSTQGSVGNLKIELYKGSSLYTTIHSSTSNDGQETWIVPGNCPEASDYRIKITETSDPNIYDYSSYFTIIEVKSITILEPTNTSMVVPKTTHTILWESTGSINDVKIELYKGTELLKELSSKTENDGSFSWVPHYYEKNGYMWNIIPQGTDYRIKIRDVYSTKYSFSEYFEITNVKSLTILEPSSSLSYKHGEIMTIKWETDTLCETLEIKVYHKPQGSSDADKVLTIPSVPNIGYYKWTIPMDLPHGEYYLVIEATDKSVHEFSEHFTIGSSSSIGYNLTFVIIVISVISIIVIIKKSNIKN